MRKVKKFAKHSEKEGTELSLVICKNVRADIRNGMYKETSFLFLTETAPSEPPIHTHTQVGQWDLLIAHPPCTHLAVSGARWFPEKQRDFRQQKACVLFMQMMLAECKHIAVENPIGIMSNVYRKPDQIIQPYEFGHATKKATCLWLKNLPPLVPTKIVEPEIVEYKCKSGKIARFGKGIGQAIGEDGKKYGFSDPMTAKIRSKTFTGIAQAMAEQWGNDSLLENDPPQYTLFDMPLETIHVQ